MGSTLNKRARDLPTHPENHHGAPEALAAAVGFVGNSAPMQAVYQLLSRVAPLDLDVLIEGETGTGKELAAEAIHRGSARTGRLIAVNCAGLPQDLFEVEMFGSERGAFTGAETKPGRFEEAAGGTLFLDEMGDLPPGAQATLLRVLDRKVVQRLGSSRDVRVNARVIAATNVDLGAAVAAGRFRQDLFQRLRWCVVRMPPLRERPGDLDLLVRAILPTLPGVAGHAGLTLSDEAWKALSAWHWPGNVREVKTVLTEALLRARGPEIDAAVLRLTDGRRDACGLAAMQVPERLPEQTLKDASDALLRCAERQWILDALKGSWTRDDAARRLGIDPKTLYRKVHELGLE